MPELRASKTYTLDPASMLRLADRNSDSRISFDEFQMAFGEKDLWSGSKENSEALDERAKQQALWSM